jgi:DNA-directed RNA polymerase subunit beta
MTRFFKKKAELEEALFGILSDLLLGEKLPFDLTYAETGEILIPAHRKITKCLLRKVALCCPDIEMEPGPLRNKLRKILGNFESRFRELEAAFYPPGMDLTVNEWL